MAGLADWLEDYRNWRGRQEWEQGKGWQDFFGGDPRAQEQFEKLSGFGTDAGGLVGMIKASHGSPHAFTKFDMSKIGTGEGAQAYGHGMYFGEGFDSPVAQSYRTAGVPASEYQDKIFLKQYHADNARLRGDKEGEERALAALAELKANPPGHLYNVELRWPDTAREAADPLGENHLLDWDAPMTKQTPEIQKAWLATKKDLPPNAIEDLGGDLSLLYGKQVTPDEFLGTLSSIGGNPGFGESLLRKAGIPGIRYLDQASRGAGEGTRNYVMFDDALANIVSRNGVSLSDLLKTSESPQNKLDAIIQNLESQGLKIDASYNPNKQQISLSRLVVPKEMRGQGVGTKAMQDLVNFADEQNALMQLSPSTDFGATSINRLKDFYKRFGFVPNTGKYKDYSISESMYRPKK